MSHFYNPIPAMCTLRSSAPREECQTNRLADQQTDMRVHSSTSNDREQPNRVLSELHPFWGQFIAHDFTQVRAVPRKIAMSIL